MAARASLKFGLWYSFRNPPQWQTSYVDLYAAHLHQIAWAETIGYDDVWLTEHHFQPEGAEMSPNPLMTQIAIATQTNK